MHLEDSRKRTEPTNKNVYVCKKNRLAPKTYYYIVHQPPLRRSRKRSLKIIIPLVRLPSQINFPQLAFLEVARNFFLKTLYPYDTVSVGP